MGTKIPQTEQPGRRDHNIQGLKPCNIDSISYGLVITPLPGWLERGGAGPSKFSW